MEIFHKTDKLGKVFDFVWNKKSVCNNLNLKWVYRVKNRGNNWKLFYAESDSHVSLTLKKKKRTFILFLVFYNVTIVFLLSLIHRVPWHHLQANILNLIDVIFGNSNRYLNFSRQNIGIMKMVNISYFCHVFEFNSYIKSTK